MKNNCAALADIDRALKEPVNTVKVNILGTVQALELCCKYNIKRFIQASTIYVNSSEGGFYRSSKKAAEDYVDEYNKIYGLNYTILRFGSLYGQRSDDTNGIKKILRNAILNNNIGYSGSQRAVRNYIHVSDASKACVDILNTKYKNMGFGSTLMQCSINFLFEKKINKIFVVTQGRNLIAQRLYQKNGFVIKNTEIWCHKWLT